MMCSATTPGGITGCDNYKLSTIYCQLASPPPPSGCDPDEESACYANGGSWDSAACTCSLTGCDPSGQQEADCYSGGGLWDSFNCTCDYTGGGGCDPDGSLEWACVSGGGLWNPANCNCGTSDANVCEPLPEQKVDEYLYYFETCGGADLWSCIEQYAVMQRCYEPGDANSVCNTCDEWVVYEGISCGLSGSCW